MNSVFDPRYVWLETVDSTNTYCINSAKNGEPEGFVVASYFQEKGRGQRGNTWESVHGENLTFSLLLRPIFLKVDEQFLVSQVIALSICDWLKSQNVDALIKWPNDIYNGNKKVAGILIENSFSSSILDVSVIGIGLNLNQTVFSKDIPNPTSLLLLTGKQYTPEIVLSELIVDIQLRYLQIQYGLRDKIVSDYLKSLYRFQQLSNFNSIHGKFKAKIVGVKHTGELILETESGEKKMFGFKEVVFEK